MNTKEKIIELYIDGLYNDEPPNVFADKILFLFGVSQRSEMLRSYNKFINEECLLGGGILSDFEIEKFEERNCG